MKEWRREMVEVVGNGGGKVWSQQRRKTMVVDGGWRGRSKVQSSVQGRAPQCWNSVYNASLLSKLLEEAGCSPATVVEEEVTGEGEVMVEVEGRRRKKNEQGPGCVSIFNLLASSPQLPIGSLFLLSQVFLIYRAPSRFCLSWWLIKPYFYLIFHH